MQLVRWIFCSILGFQLGIIASGSTITRLSLNNFDAPIQQRIVTIIDGTKGDLGADKQIKIICSIMDPKSNTKPLGLVVVVLIAMKFAMDSHKVDNVFGRGGHCL